MNANTALPLTLIPVHLAGSLKNEPGGIPLLGGAWYTAEQEGDGLAYQFPVGTLMDANYISTDLLLDGKFLCTFTLILQEGENGPECGFMFGLLNQVSARMRMPLEAVNQNRWRYPREGAWLKPMAWKDPVSLDRVDRMKLVVTRKPAGPVRWCMTPLIASVDAPPKLDSLVLPKGTLIDELGQSRLHTWPSRSHSVDEVTERLQSQMVAAPRQHFPDNFNRWGGWKGKRFDATGFFRRTRDDQRWWLVDPDGYAFWSAGLDCVEPGIESAYEGLESALDWLPDLRGGFKQIFGFNEGITVDYLKANFIRAFGPNVWQEKWAEITIAAMRGMGFNTIGNWSDWRTASRAGFPYVRPMDGNNLDMPRVYRDFPDVFDPKFDEVKANFAEQLRETAIDPAMIGYFLMNEPTWGFAQYSPAAGMLINTPSCTARFALSRFLKERYLDETALSAAWGVKVDFNEVAEGIWKHPYNQQAIEDLNSFSEVMVVRYFGGLSEACRKVDSKHMNLGARYYTIPPAWAVEGMRSFDVFSMNCYQENIPADEMSRISQMLDQPILIGEWHFGALDAGLPASGIGHVPDQTSRGKAYRVYIEDAAAKPWCVGVHYFTLYDESALGRFDGENYNIGFLDVCNRPYEQLAAAARASHERIYDVANATVKPYHDVPAYLPRLFL